MLFSIPSRDDPSWTAAVKTPGTKNILGFNEPDLTYSDSANILPAAAADGYKTYIEPFMYRDMLILESMKVTFLIRMVRGFQISGWHMR
jgi:hypothetical protein